MLTRRLLLACLAAFLCADAARGAAAQSGASTYLDILERYRRGDADAVAALAALDARAIDAGAHVVIKEFEAAFTPESRGTRLLRTAIVAHTDAALTARQGPTVIPWSPHLSITEQYVQHLAAKKADDPLAVDWWLLAVGVMHAQRNYAQAMTAARHALRAGGERPEFLLATGVTHELAWSWEHEEGIRTPFSGSLEEAEKAYARVVAQQPALVEARVRLGRVQTLRGASEPALRTLGGVPAAAEPAWVYLARLFEGDAFERQGRIAEAQQRYAAAARLAPAAQSAQLALAYAQYQDGARSDAAGRVREVAGNRGVADDSDPWFWYSLGFAWLVRPELDALRALVRR